MACFKIRSGTNPIRSWGHQIRRQIKGSAPTKKNGKASRKAAGERPKDSLIKKN